jgi:prepilin-type N-terminal cleavage/methylation domain-containing protein
VRRGFTLIEFIIVIALIALVGGLVAVNAEAILRGLGEEPVDRILQKAVREARFQAAYLKQPTQLRFDEESAAFRVITRDGAALAEFTTGLTGPSDRLRITFEQILPERGLTAGTLEQTVEIDAVTFLPDRSSTPFQVLIDHERSPFTQRFDPFSDIVIDDSRQQ